MGHLISMVELAKSILRRHPSFQVTILTPPPSFNSASTYFRHLSATEPSITFHYLPPIPTHDIHGFPSKEAFSVQNLHRNIPHVRRALETITRSSTIAALVIDMFCTPALPIAAELHIPTYYFITSGAAFLALLFYFPILDKMLITSCCNSFKDMKNTVLDVPGIPPLSSSEMVTTMANRSEEMYHLFQNTSIDLPKSSGILVNTFESFETKPLKSILEGECNPGCCTPPVFCVGPLLATTTQDEHDCIKWLDKQPSKSVIYLCFGSFGSFSEAQLKETAEGLERSGYGFLWVVRPPDYLLLSDFLDRTKDRGLVVTSWVPQVAVLNHESVSGFVTHCGWNSVLEAVWARVPMVAWPMYAEQHLNRNVMVEEMKVAVRVAEGFVAATEVEERVREVMDVESEIRKVVKEKRLEARAAVGEAGSSVAAIEKIVQLWKSAG